MSVEEVRLTGSGKKACFESRIGQYTSQVTATGFHLHANQESTNTETREALCEPRECDYKSPTGDEDTHVQTRLLEPGQQHVARNFQQDVGYDLLAVGLLTCLHSTHG